jgi:hypothetical protein
VIGATKLLEHRVAALPLGAPDLARCAKVARRDRAWIGHSTVLVSSTA